MMDIFLCGMMAACNWVVAVIFFRFWRQTHDRLLLLFAIAFVVFGFSRVPRAFLDPGSGWSLFPFVVRCVAYCLLLLAIIDKNLDSRKRS